MKPLLAATAALLLSAGAASAQNVVGLTADGRLVPFDGKSLSAGAAVPISGVEGAVIGIDVRPADGMLYAVSDRGAIYTVDPRSGAAKMVSKLNQPFAGAPKAVVDFNPVADRLRLIALDGTSLRVNVATGEAVVDGKLRYADNDVNKGKAPTVTTGAYTNSMAGAKETALYDIDTALDVLALQAPPNDGILQTRGKLGVDLAPTTAFDIAPTGDGGNAAWAVSGQSVYTIDLQKGSARKVGDLKNLPGDLIDIAVMPM
jgi:hypothetical protein